MAAGVRGDVDGDGRDQERVVGLLEVLDQHLEREAARIDERRRDLEAAREIVGRLTSGSPVTRRQPGVEPLSEALAPSLVSRLLRETSGPMRNYVYVIDAGPAFDEPTRRESEERIARGNEMRTIYPSTILDSEAGRSFLMSWAGIGEQQRIVTETVTEFAVFGDSAAVTFSRWGDPASGYVLFREPIMVFGLCEYFDLAWRHAMPVQAGRGVDPQDERLIELLGLGLKDEAIARMLGIGLRTVRRRISTLMTTHGVTTRFQLGAVLDGRPASGSSPRRAARRRERP